MSNLDVALRVRLLTETGNARRAARDINEIDKAVDNLKRGGGGGAPRAITDIPPAARRAKRDIIELGGEARRLGREKTGDAVEQGLRRISNQAKRTQRDILDVRAQARRLEGAGSARPLGSVKKGIEEVEGKAGLLDRSFVRLGGSAAQAFGALAAFAAPTAIIAGLNQVEDRVTALDRKYAALAVTAEMRDPAVVKRLREQDTAIGMKYGMRPEQVQPLRGAFVAGGLDLDTAQNVTDPSARAVKAMDASAENVAQTVLAGIQNLKLTPEQIPAYLDQIAKGTKLGRFEADSVAKFMPQFGAAYQGMGYTGLDASAEINALAQIVRQGSGTADAAGTNLDNLLQKVFAPDAVKNFKEKGVDLEAVRDRAKKEGKSYVAAVLEEVNKLTKGGDPFLTTELFGDMQVLGALRAVIPNLDKLEEWRKAIRDGSAGTVEQDWQFLAKTPAEEQQKMGAIAGAGRDEIAKSWWQPFITGLSRLDAFLFNSQEFNRQRSLEVTNPEEFKRREQLQRRSEGVAAQRDMGGYNQDRQYIDDLITQSKIDIRAMKAKGAEAGSALGDGLRSAGPDAVKAMDDIMNQIEARGNVTISPRIAPQIAPTAPAPAAPAAPTPAPERRSAAPSSRSFAQANTFNIYGAADPQRSARAVDRRLARLGSGASALNDTVG